MKKRWRLGLVTLILTFAVFYSGCGRKPQEQRHKMPDVRSPDISIAIEIPGVPSPVIPNELVVMLKEGKDLEAFKKSLEDKDIKIVGHIPIFRIVQIEVPSSRREEIKEKLRENENVDSVVYQSLFESYAKFNDPVFTNDDPWDDWNFKAINAEAAWDITRGDPKVTIAIVDAGTLFEHEELKDKIVFSGSIWTDDGSHAGTNLDHGTHVAIIAAGSGDNGVGTSGVAPGCSVMPVQAGGSVGGYLSSFIDLLAGISFAAQNGADVINLSMGPRFLVKYVNDYQNPATRDSARAYFLSHRRDNQRFVNEVFAASEAMGSVIVVAAGNHSFPGDFNALVHNPFSLTVGMVEMTDDGTIAPVARSNYGYMVRVSAPGFNIYSGISKTPSSYGFMIGTSMAAPHVSGLAGLILSVNPKLTPQEVRQVIIASAFTEGKEGGLRWHNELPWTKKEMDSWRQAFLLLMGKDESRLLDDIAQYYMLSLIPIEYNLIWAGGNDAVGAFIDARRALELAKSGEFRKRFAAFTEEDYDQALKLKPERLVQVQNMLKFRNRYAASQEVPSFELKFSDELNRLIVVRDEHPGSGYSEWLEYIEPGRYHHFAEFNAEDYSRGVVELLQSDKGLRVMNLRRKTEKAYALFKERPAASQSPAQFYTVAGGSEPNKTGKLVIRYEGPKGSVEEKEFYAYPQGAESEPENILYAARTSGELDMIIGKYDIRILSWPRIWFKGVNIEEGKTTELEAGGYGKILIAGNDSAGEPIKVSFNIYEPEDKDNFLASGTTNQPLDTVTGNYYVYVNLNPDITFEDVIVRRKETTTLKLPSRGRLSIVAKNFEGKPLKIAYRIYKKGDWDDALEYSATSKPVDLPPGEYNVYVDSDPDIKYENVRIKPSEITELTLPEYGALLVKGVDAAGKPLFAKAVYLYKPGGNNIVSSTHVNKRRDIAAGEYDLKVGLKPYIHYKGIKIEPGKVLEIELPQWGELSVNVKDRAGKKPLRIIELYRSKERKQKITWFDRKSGLVPPGTYFVWISVVGKYEDTWVNKPVNIKAAEKTEINVTVKKSK